MKLSDFDYPLPPERIAQRPLLRREDSRLLLLDRAQGELRDYRFIDLPGMLHGDEFLVLNNTRVLPARLFGRRTGARAEPAGKSDRMRHQFLSAQIEVLLTRQLGDDLWQALVRPGRKVRVGEKIIFGEGELAAEVTARGDLGLRTLHFCAPTGTVREQIERLGHMPLPPYIERPDEPSDRERYQTVYAKQAGAVAAPTAGLHFSQETFAGLAQRGIPVCEITLQVGLGTFQPIHEEDIAQHKMHEESYEITEGAAETIAKARAEGRRILAVGTTVVRALEDSALKSAEEGSAELLKAGQSDAGIFIQPGHKFRVVDQLLTNFHLPKSTLLVLVCAFAGRSEVLAAYRHALEMEYRFYSYGDCMLIR